MKISYKWLKQYIDFDFEPEKISELLTDCGLEVEGLEKFQSIKGGLQGIVIGEVKTCKKMQDTDHLSLTSVDIGEENALSIVCGAPNVAAGQKVLVATVGTTLYSGEDSFKIKKTKMRGEISEGMICAEDELGLGSSHQGIMVLESSAKTGTPAAEFFNVEEDWIFEIGLTPNRSDATSHIGVTRDLVAVINTFYPEKKTKLKTPSVDNFKIDNNLKHIEVIIDDIEACPRYSGITISGIEVKESPVWLKNKLNSVGLRPINNIVDATNFVLMECGQPLHPFDTDEIEGDKVIIRKAKKDTKFITLDETERNLTENDLMICNSKTEMCIAGVFGGINSGISNKTKNIFIESAYFSPTTVRKTSKHHGLQTDASFRFERGADPNITIYALKRAAMLIKELAGGKISSEIVDVYPKAINDWEIDVLYENIDRLIGKTIERKTIKNILEYLEIKILEENNDGLKLLVPTFKIDVKREVDIIEEILRIYGYNNIEISQNLKSSINYIAKPDKDKFQNQIADFLSNNGFAETINNSLTKSEYIEKNNFLDSTKNVNILNPLSKDLNIMRQTLLFGGLENLIHNINRKNFDLKLYEFGKSYCFNPEHKSENDVLLKFSEKNHLVLFLTGRKYVESWNTTDDEVDFYSLKSVVNNILKYAGINICKLKAEQESSGVFIDNLNYSFKKNKLVEFGLIQKSILKQFNIKQAVYYADFDWDSLINLSSKNKIEYKELPKFPEVRRDLALLIDENISFENIEKLAYQYENKFIKKVNLFDIYDGSKIEEGKKSYAVSFVLQDEEKTLTEKLIDKIMNKLMTAFKDKLGAEIR